MYHLSTQEKIQLQAAPLGTGGEGTVFAVEKPSHYQGYVAKIYHQTERKPERALKINYLISNPLLLKDKLSFIFPEYLLYEDGEFVGYLMPKARGEYDLTVLTSLTVSNKLSDDWVAQYRRDKPENLRNYQKIAHHLALAFAEFYQQEEYIFTDLKPENIKVNLQGKISVIDLDSLQIQHQGKVLFPAEKISQEYSPPEREIFKEGEVLSPAWTYFSLSVILYKLLLGLHPFSVTGKGDLRRLATLADKMKYGLFPFGQHSDKIEVIPAPHHNFKSLPQAWQDLFTKSLATFLTQPEYRPDAQAWAAALQIKTLALREYKNPLSKTRVAALQNPDDFLFDRSSPLTYAATTNGMMAPFLIGVLGLSSMLYFGMWTYFAAMGLLMFNNLSRFNLKIDLKEQKLIVKHHTLLGLKFTRKYKLSRISAILERTTWGNGKRLKVTYQNSWGIESTVFTLKIYKQGKNRQEVKTILKEFFKLNIPINMAGLDIDKI